MEMSTLEDLLVEQLKDLYSAEDQLVKALPKLVKAATSPDLKKAFEEHLEETKGHVTRLEEAFILLGKKAVAKKCKAMEGLIEEGSELISEDADPDVKDAGLIGAAQKVEHYEIAAYGTVRAYAELLDLPEVADLLAQTLEEEKEADENLTELATDAINLQAAAGDDDDEEDDEEGDDDAGDDEIDEADEDEEAKSPRSVKSPAAKTAKSSAGGRASTRKR